MMLRRRMASARPGARGSLTRKPSPSGPRCRMAAAMARTRASASEEVLTKATPQIPHTRLFYLRRGEKRAANPPQMNAQTVTGDHQPAVGIPGQRLAQQQQEKNHKGSQGQSEERFALEEQAPIQFLIPIR